jgi:aspartyl-tRNA(Asn)/glutamyl-tRNA(Gln) amidotransferase subunit A
LIIGSRRGVAFSKVQLSTTKGTKLHEESQELIDLRVTSCPSWFIRPLRVVRYNEAPATPMPFLNTIAELAPRLRRKEVSPLELTRTCLDRIDQLDPKLNAFITVTAESALAEARVAEIEIARGEWRGPLHGIPVALKDLIDIAGTRTTAGSAVYQNRVPTEDAEVVRRLRQAGAVILGKNNLHEFAYGGSSLVSFFGEVHNPRNTAHIAGGSSGGSAAAVAAGMCYAAIGTDTAGSIREPAALCGCVGIKPTYGRVSARGVIPLSWSLDHVGPLAATVADAAIVLQAIAGYDPLDIHSADVPVSDYVSVSSSRPDEGAKTLRVGIPRPYFYDDLNDEVRAAVEQALRVIGTLVAETREVQIEIPADRVVQNAESYAIHADDVSRRPELYQAETVRRIRNGENISTVEYIRHRQDLDRERRRAHGIFENVDLLLTPTTPIPAPAIADLKKDPAALRPAELILLRNTRPFNVWGLPAISVPCGFTKAGLPIGLQIAGPRWREDLVLRLAHAYEQATEWHKRRLESGSV